MSYTRGESFHNQKQLSLESGPSPLLLQGKGLAGARDSRRPEDSPGVRDKQAVMLATLPPTTAGVARVIDGNPFAQQSPPVIEHKATGSSLTNKTGATGQPPARSPEDDRLEYATPSPDDIRDSKQSSPRQSTPINRKASKLQPAQAMLPNGSIVSCSLAVKQLIESIPPRVRIKQFLRLAH